MRQSDSKINLLHCEGRWPSHIFLDESALCRVVRQPTVLVIYAYSLHKQWWAWAPVPFLLPQELGQEPTQDFDARPYLCIRMHFRTVVFFGPVFSIYGGKRRQGRRVNVHSVVVCRSSCSFGIVIIIPCHKIFLASFLLFCRMNLIFDGINSFFCCLVYRSFELLFLCNPTNLINWSFCISVLV